LAETLRKQLNVDPKLIEGAGGVFEVHLEGNLIWSKLEKGRFPEHSEVVESIRGATGNGHRS
jgi:selenoprotein W-related protein